jgi:hypothetical protein
MTRQYYTGNASRSSLHCRGRRVPYSVGRIQHEDHSKGQHLYKSANGASAENEETKAAAKRLKYLVGDLQQSSQARTDVWDKTPASLGAITTECLKVEDELALELEKLRVSAGAKFRQWKSFRQALKCV